MSPTVELAREPERAVAVVPLAPSVTAEQLDLIARTIAKDATPDELKLYLFDCARQGVHPLDKLIHFTKRNGKYTPITSIDFMRIRAAETGEMAGSDDAVYDALGAGAVPMAASVTVYRLTQGQRFPYQATARWSEYKPEQNDFMWRKMPHLMLGKCAEALALRKAFPKQLSGLYVKEEMDQAGNGYPPEPPAPTAPASPPEQGEREKPAAATVENRGPSETNEDPVLAPASWREHEATLPAGAVFLLKVTRGWKGGKALGFLQHSGQAVGAEDLGIFQEHMLQAARVWCASLTPVNVVAQIPSSGKPYVKTLTAYSPFG